MLILTEETSRPSPRSLAGKVLQKAGVAMFLRFLKKKRISFSIFNLSLCEEQIRDTNMIFRTILCNLNSLLWFWFAIECYKTYVLAISGWKTLGLADALGRNWKSWQKPTPLLHWPFVECSVAKPHAFQKKACLSCPLCCRTYSWSPITFLQPYRKKAAWSLEVVV